MEIVALCVATLAIAIVIIVDWRTDCIAGVPTSDELRSLHKEKQS